MNKENKKIIIIGALSGSLINFRGELLTALIDDGWSVVAMANGANEKERLAVTNKGVKYREYKIERNGMNAVKDIQTFFDLRAAIKQERPDVIFCYTIKPVIWGGLASAFSGRPKFIALITGLGFTFQKGTFLKSCLIAIVSLLYRLSLQHASAVIFQNSDNRNVMEDRHICDPKKSKQVNGSGVNIKHYTFSEVDNTKTTFLLIARLLKAKGIKEYAEAASIVKKQYPDSVIQILGPKDPSPNAFPIKTLQELHDEGVIEYLGETDDVRPFIKNCQVYVLPSYHEGLPRTVIEAMSIGRPIITTDVPGCRDTIIDNANGILVPAKNSNALAQAMIEMIERRDEWNELGRRSRKFAEDIFDVNKVNQNLIAIIDQARKSP